MGDDEVRWLDGQQQHAWRVTLEGITRLLDVLNDDLKATTGLTLDDYEVLVNLSESPERRLRMSELADRLISSRSRLTYRVDRLERAGLVRRQACPEDGRAIHAVITDAGFERLRGAAPTHVRSVRRHLVDRFERDDFLTLGALLERVAAPLRP